MRWDDGRDRLNDIIKQNKIYNENEESDKIVYDCGEWSSHDGLEWSTINDDGVIIIYNPDGEDYYGNSIWEEIDYDKAYQWYEENIGDLAKKYGGQVIAVIDDEVVAYGATEEEVENSIIKSNPGSIPFMAHVPTERELQCQI